MQWRRLALIVGCLFGVAALASCGVLAWKLVEAGGLAGVHQRGVTNEMASWEREYRTLRDWREAWRAAEMLEYARNYYVPGPGYRGSTRTESELEAQRARTLAAIAGGLREFTGEEFGTDAAKWREWLTEQGHGEGR
jgi:hypothetical protein